MNFGYLRKAFFSVAGAGLLTLTSSFNSVQPQKDNTAVQTDPARTEQVTPAQPDAAQPPVKFDYAFGDQVAKNMNLPGASGDDWGPQALYRGLRDFNKKHPGELKGKNVFIAIEDGTMLGAMIYIPKVADLIEEIHAANVVVMGVSETRTDLDGKDVNRQLKEYVEKHHATYGGAILCADPKQGQGIYVTSADCFAAIKTQAEQVLRQKALSVAPASRPAGSQAPKP